MEFGASIFFTDYSIIRRLAVAMRSAALIRYGPPNIRTSLYRAHAGRHRAG